MNIILYDQPMIFEPTQKAELIETDPASKTILIVDDDSTAVDFFEMLLLRRGFKTATAKSGKSALGRLSRDSARKMDLLLLDLMMPGESGYEIIKKLQEPEYQAVPICVITARELDRGMVDMIKSEPNVRDYFLKPVNSAQLTSKIHQILGTQPAQ